MMINLCTKELLRLPGNSEMVHHQPSHGLFPKSKSKTGATPASRAPTGALLKKLPILMREPSNKRVLCSFKRPRRTGAIDKFTPMSGAMVRSREEKV